MVYVPELYLQDERNLPFQDAVLVTATTVSCWCSHYRAELIVAKSKHVMPTCKSGALPTNTHEKAAFVTELVSWIFENSLIHTLFCLRLDDELVSQQGKVTKFDHHDDTGCWALDLTESEFAELQAAWQGHGLPKDLFYAAEKTLCIPRPGTGLIARLLRALGVQQCYTPRQWERATLAESARLANQPD
jgi:hypothetical protein